MTSLAEWGQIPDHDLPVLDVLWDLARLEQSPEAVAAAQSVVQDMRTALAKNVPETATSLNDQHIYLQDMIHHQFGFTTDTESGEPENINLVTVVERRCGLPVALAALYIDLADTQDWVASGLNFPGHFLVQLKQGAQTILIDPADGTILQAHDLRRLLKDTLGVHAELQHNHYQIATIRQLILRFYNNQKTALINADKIADALQVVESLLQIAPHEPRLHYDAAVLATRLDKIDDAIIYWEKFILLSDNKTEKDQAKYILSRLQSL